MSFVVVDRHTGEQWPDFTSANLTDPPDPSQVFAKTKAVLVALENTRAEAAAVSDELTTIAVRWEIELDRVRVRLYTESDGKRMPSKEVIEALAAAEHPDLRRAYLALTIRSKAQRDLIAILEAESKLTQTLNVQTRPGSNY